MAAVDKIEDQRKPEDFIGHRNTARQVLSAQMSLTSVFGMGSDGSTACGGSSDLSEWPGSARAKPASPGDGTAGHPSRKQVEPVRKYKKRARPEPDSLLCSRYLSSRAVARQVLSAQMSLTSVFGMGTGGPSS